MAGRRARRHPGAARSAPVRGHRRRRRQPGRLARDPRRPLAAPDRSRDRRPGRGAAAAHQRRRFAPPASRSSARSIRTSSSQPGWLDALLATLDGRRDVGGRAGLLHDRPRDALVGGARDGARSRAALRGHRRTRHRPRLHGQHGLPGRGAPRRRPLRRDAGLRLRQRHELSAARGRLSPAVLPRRAQRASLARGARRLPAPAVRLRLRPPRPRRATSRRVSAATPSRRQA